MTGSPRHDPCGQYRSNNGQTPQEYPIQQGRREAPTTHPSPPDPYGWVPPFSCDDEGEKGTGACGGTVGVGGMVDVGRGPCADPASPSTPYLSGIDRKGRDGVYPSSTLRHLQGGDPMRSLEYTS